MPKKESQAATPVSQGTQPPPTKPTRKEEKKKKNKPRSAFANFGLGKEKDFFMENLALLLTAGMDILSALDAVREEMKSKRMQEIITEIKEDIDGGSTMGSALERTRLLPMEIVSLIRVGEETGRLSENLKVVVAQQQKERIFKSQVRSAMMYPVFVLFLTLVVGTSIAWFILPKMARIFTDLNLELPLVTRVLIRFGDLLGKYGVYIIPVFILLLSIVFYFLFLYSKTKHIGQRMLYAVPGIHRLIQEVELARFGFILGTLLESGLPVVNALSSLQEAATVRASQALYKHLRENIEDGNSFQKSFASYPKGKRIIPISIQHMVVAGEQSGHLSETLLKIGQTFEQKVEITTKNLTVILEPIMLIVVWLGVVGVALAVILPIYNLIGGIGNA